MSDSTTRGSAATALTPVGDSLPPVKTWTYLVRVTVSCERPDAEQWSRPERLNANVECAGRILIVDGKARLLTNNRIQWSGDVSIRRLYAPFRGDSHETHPDAAALDFGMVALRVALSSIWKWERDQDLPGRIETKTRRLRLIEGALR